MGHHRGPREVRAEQCKQMPLKWDVPTWHRDWTPLPGVISLIHVKEHTDYNLLAVDLLFSLGS